MMECIRLMMIAWTVAKTQQAVVITAQGALRGETHQGYVSFTGIPYATIVDNGRFKRAGIAPTWPGIREPQPARCSRSSPPEDCLTLEVHTPAEGAPWPVLAWVRAGGRYSPAKLVQQGIIVVLISHRLGPTGFLCLDDERIPGNAGVKDVVLALRWVRDNISAFKGNPYKVVVGGQGYAGAMVEALLLAPMAQGLFHGAIVQSGSVLCPWAFFYDARERSLMLGQMFDENDEPSALVKADVRDLAEKANTMAVPYFPCGMCVEKDYRHEERLLPESPHRLLSKKYSRQVPLIMGYNSDEAYVFLSLLRQRSLRKRLLNDMSLLLPEELKFSNEVELKNVVKQIQDQYFRRNFSMASLLAYHRDAYFTSHIDRSVRQHATSSLPVYYYRFSHRGARGVQPDHEVDKTGAAHSDELAYLFPDTTRDLDGADGVVQRNLLTLWTSFVKNLVPSPPGASYQWDPVDSSDPRLLDISAEPAMNEGPRLGVWDDVYERFYYAKDPHEL